uniref:Serine carboxypeptidase n=1 Tax=Panagrolaimus davidi TaxID=227884 RepID=A0A914PJT4_9BILA
MSSVRILVYNGDVDTVCNFLGDAKFIDGVAKNHGFTVDIPRKRWWFRDNVAGFFQRYSGGNNFQIDVLTVKGAGHMVPMDRPGPSMQMISNFILADKPDYSYAQFVDPTAKPAPLLSQSGGTSMTPPVSVTSSVTMLPPVSSSTEKGSGNASPVSGSSTSTTTSLSPNTPVATVTMPNTPSPTTMNTTIGISSTISTPTTTSGTQKIAFSFSVFILSFLLI